MLLLAWLRFFRLRRKTTAKMMAPSRTMPPTTPPAMAPTGVLFFFFLVLVLADGGKTSTGSIEVCVEPGALVIRVKDTDAALFVDVLVLGRVDAPSSGVVI